MDVRRHVRHGDKPIYNYNGFIDFVFSNPHYSSRIFIDVHRAFKTLRSPAIVFTHGDFRPQNIIVELNEQGKYRVNGILD
jgi:hypothetical protein